MELIFADDKFPTTIIKSIFLAGPSPRDKETLDWRVEALEILKSLNYDGTVFIPIPKNKFYGQDDSKDWTYDNQINWECEGRARADKILFWVPRNILGKMPAFTTNIEFGEDLNSGKIVYGRPKDAEKCRYLDKRIQDRNQPVFETLSELLKYTISSLGNGSLRVNGETTVPLFIWNTSNFKSWYQSLKENNNRLEWATLLNFHEVNNIIFAFTLHVKIWLESEQRYKSNEFIFSRKDTSSVLAYYIDENKDKHVLLIKEFRSSVRNNLGYVYELPGGSAWQDINYQENAQHELHEETGLYINDNTRFNFVSERQILATLCSHTNSLYCIQLNKEEFNTFNNSSSYGNKEDSEITYPIMIKLKDIYKYPVDYSTLGMIFEALNNEN